MRVVLLLALVWITQVACSTKGVTIQHGDLKIEFNEEMFSRVSSNSAQTPIAREFTSSEYLECQDFDALAFELKEWNTKPVKDSIGTGNEWRVSGVFTKEKYQIEKLVTITCYDRFPDEVFFRVQYRNNSDRGIVVKSWVNNHYAILPGNDSIPFWSFQGESTGARKDWILPLTAGFQQRNFMGMNNTDYGGGIPLLDVWRSDHGIAIGHAETAPQLISLPVAVDMQTRVCDIKIMKDSLSLELAPGDTLRTIQTFVGIHKGDCFASLRRYSMVLQAKGIRFAKPEPQSFEPSWCAWGYMRDFTVDEIMGTLPKVKELGIKWVTIDDGFQQAEGDWHVNEKKFPRGDQEMEALVRNLHAQGFKVMLWWAPLAADPESKLLRENPDLISHTAEGAPHFITWWDANYLAPSFEKTRQHTKEMLELFLHEWDVDGLKMDGQHLNAVHPDYNPAHALSSPESAPATLPGFYKMIYEEANRIKPNTVLQICPCGTCMSVFNMPFMNQAVASDPLSSWQIRLKGKTYKAIIPEGAYFGDHVELSDGRSDFASTIGIGGVPGTKFTWPKENPSVHEDNLLTADRELSWEKWFGIYNEKMLSTGNYLGDLYDIGYDIPETHVIQKSDTLFYAFYRKTWSGDVSFRGLGAGKYRVHDFVNDLDLGTVTKENSNMKVKFEQYLLVEVYPL